MFCSLGLLSCVLFPVIFILVSIGQDCPGSDLNCGVVVSALDLQLEIAGSIPAAALSSATLDILFTHIVQHL